MYIAEALMCMSGHEHGCDLSWGVPPILARCLRFKGQSEVDGPMHEHNHNTFIDYDTGTW